MDIDQLINFFNKERIIFYSFKPLALIFSFFYILFSLVILKQTEVMNKTVNTKTAPLIFTISLFQLLLSILIFLLAVFIL